MGDNDFAIARARDAQLAWEQVQREAAERGDVWDMRTAEVTTHKDVDGSYSTGLSGGFVDIVPPQAERPQAVPTRPYGMTRAEWMARQRR